MRLNLVSRIIIQRVLIRIPIHEQVVRLVWFSLPEKSLTITPFSSPTHKQSDRN